VESKSIFNNFLKSGLFYIILIHIDCIKVNLILSTFRYGKYLIVNFPFSGIYRGWDVLVTWWLLEINLQKPNFYPFLVFNMFLFSVSRL
jgi:hypothetical protein